MTYGYDSKLAGEPKAENRLLDYKRHFIQMIKNARRLEPKRPIIFIGHSLGAVLIVEVRYILGLMHVHGSNVFVHV